MRYSLQYCAFYSSGFQSWTWVGTHCTVHSWLCIAHNKWCSINQKPLILKRITLGLLGVPSTCRSQLPLGSESTFISKCCVQWQCIFVCVCLSFLTRLVYLLNNKEGTYADQNIYSSVKGKLSIRVITLRNQTSQIYHTLIPIPNITFACSTETGNVWILQRKIMTCQPKQTK